MMTDWKARPRLKSELVENTSAARLQVDISLGVPTVWQGVKAHIELLDRTRESGISLKMRYFARASGSKAWRRSAKA